MAQIRKFFNTLTRNWQRTHAVLAPFGAGITTWVLSVYAVGGSWAFWYNWKQFADMASIGLIIYGMSIALLEGGGWLVFWALDERAKRRQRRKRQQEAELLDRVEAALVQNPDSDPVTVIEQLRGIIRSEPTSKG